MKYFSIQLVILAVFSLNMQAQEVITAIDKLLIEYQTDTIGIPNYKEFLENIRIQEMSELKINGELGFGLTLKNSEKQDLTEFSVSAKASRGFFPGEFIFSTGITVTVKDGEFIENLSDLTMSYDHHLGNDLDFELYTFLKRSSNNFLNIDQRYEVGLGVVWNTFLSGKGITKKEKEIDKNTTITVVEQQKQKQQLRKARLTPSGRKKMAALRAFRDHEGNRLSEEVSDNFLQPDSVSIRPNPNAILTEKEIPAFRSGLKRSIMSVIKEESNVRVSLLAGINYESERTSDSLKLVFIDTVTVKDSFKPVSLIRAVVGPGMELKIDQFTLKSRCYFKLGISDDDLKSKVRLDGMEDEKLNYRVEWINSAVIKFNQEISMTGTLSYIHINAPRRGFYLIAPQENALFSSANRFINFQIGFTYSL